MGFPQIRKTDGTSTARESDMSSDLVVSVVIPAFNEEQRLEPTVRSIVAYLRARGTPSEVIVVDDGSRDGTSDLVARFSTEFSEIRLIRLARNSGKGCAVRTGVVNA